MLTCGVAQRSTASTLGLIAALSTSFPPSYTISQAGLPMTLHKGGEMKNGQREEILNSTFLFFFSTGV
jgi:hypothetical protein